MCSWSTRGFREKGHVPKPPTCRWKVDGKSVSSPEPDSPSITNNWLLVYESHIIVDALRKINDYNGLIAEQQGQGHVYGLDDAIVWHSFYIIMKRVTFMPSLPSRECLSLLTMLKMSPLISDVRDFLPGHVGCIVAYRLCFLIWAVSSPHGKKWIDVPFCVNIIELLWINISVFIDGLLQNCNQISQKITFSRS